MHYAADGCTRTSRRCADENGPLDSLLDQYAGTLYFGLLAGGFAVLVVLESFAPRRPLDLGLGSRWITNVGLLIIDTLLLRSLQPVAAVGIAYYAVDRDWGLVDLNSVHPVAGIVLAILLLDLGRYWEHVALHRFKPLWRIHKVHHTDLDFDCTTGLRFHPLEAVIGVGVDAAVIVAFGVPPMAVVLLSLVYVTETLFNHANLRLPTGLERALRWVIVTPDMHRVHHSADRRETDTNYAVLFSWWDRMFGTYRAQPAAGHAGMTMGLHEHRDPLRLSVHRLLLMPFQRGRPTPVIGDRRPDNPPLS